MNNTLSLCVICKNEEDNIPKLLKSVKGDLFDEIIVTDTGSTDKTLFILNELKQSGNFNLKIEKFKWIDDFSAARNYCFSKATSDYIMWLDSDDYIKQKDYQKLLELKTKLHESPMWLLKYEYAHDQFGNSICSFYRERIVKRSLNLKWQEPIHEYLPLASYKQMDIEVHHNKQHTTSERNIRILEKIVKKRPNEARNVYYLGKEYMDCGKLEKGYEQLSKFVRMSGAWSENIYSAHLRLSEYYRDIKENNKAKEQCFFAIEVDPLKAKAYCYLADIFLEEKDYHKSIHWYKVASNMERSENSLDVIEPKYHTWLPHLQMCLAYNALGKVIEAAEENEKALAYLPQDPRMLNNKTIFERSLGDEYPYPKKKLDPIYNEFMKVEKTYDTCKGGPVDRSKDSAIIAEENKKLPEFKGKVGWFCSTANWFASNRIRMLNIQKTLKDLGYYSEVCTLQDYKRFDIIVTGKEYTPEHLELIKKWKFEGIKVICDINEDILQFPNVKEIIRECDYVVCCSRALQDKVSRLIKDSNTNVHWGFDEIPANVFVIEDSLDYEECL